MRASRSQRASFNLQRTVGATTIQLMADSFDTYFGEDSFRVNRRLPSFQVRQAPQKLGKTGVVLNYEGRAERLTLGTQDIEQEYSRFDFAPELSRPLQLSFLQLNPQVGVRYTRWTRHRRRRRHLHGPALGRQRAEASLEMRGPRFSRVFDRPGGAYTNRIKRVIGPEVNLTSAAPRWTTSSPSRSSTATTISWARTR